MGSTTVPFATKGKMRFGLNHTDRTKLSMNESIEILVINQKDNK